MPWVATWALATGSEMNYDLPQGRATRKKDEKGSADNTRFIFPHNYAMQQVAGFCSRSQEKASRAFRSILWFTATSWDKNFWKVWVFSQDLYSTSHLKILCAGVPTLPPTILLRLDLALEANVKAKLTKSLSEQARGGSRGSMSHLKRGPSSIPPATILCPGFSPPLTPSCDPFVGEKWSRSLEPANYRALTSALLNPKCWRTFQQLTDLCFCECVRICCFIFIEMWAQQRKCLFHRCHKAALPRGKSQLIRNA